MGERGTAAGAAATGLEETGLDTLLGGRSNPHHLWDLFDTPPQSGNVRGQVIDIDDQFRFDRFGTFTELPPSKTEAFTEALSAPLPTGYHAAFDRSPPGPGGDAWGLGPPDGAVDVSDIFFAVAQFGHSCA